MSCTLESHVQILGEVPAQREVTVPQELLTERQGQIRILGILEVALLQLTIHTHHLGIERDILGQIVEAKCLGEVHPLGLALGILERFPGLEDWRIGIVERATPLVIILVNGGLARGVTVRVRIRE